MKTKLLWVCLLLVSCRQETDWRPQHIVALLEYPRLARFADVQGLVQLSCSLTDEGTVQSCAAKGHPLLSEAAVKNVKGWTFARPSPHLGYFKKEDRLVAPRSTAPAERVALIFLRNTV